MWRPLFIVIFLLVALGALVGFAATLQVDGGTLQVFRYTVSIPTPTFTFTPTPSDTPTSTPTSTPTPTPTPAAWDRSSLEFIDQGATCDDGGAVWATVKNEGEDMAGESSWALYLQDELVESDSFPALASGETYNIAVSVNQGGTYKFKGYQRPGKPGKGFFWSQEILFDPQSCSDPSTGCVITPTPTLAPVLADCVKTLEFWLSHPEDWPVEVLPLGGEIYTKAEIMPILEMQVGKDVTYFLAQQLLVTKLNLHSGVVGLEIEKTVTRAENWLQKYPLGSLPLGPQADEGYALAVHLGDFNQGLVSPQLCPGQVVPTYPPGPVVSPSSTPSPQPTLALVETSTPSLSATPVGMPTQAPTATPLVTPTLAPTLEATATPEPAAVPTQPPPTPTMAPTSGPPTASPSETPDPNPDPTTTP